MGTLFSCLRVLVGGDLKTLVLQAKSVAMSGCCKGGRRESLENWPKESFQNAQRNAGSLPVVHLARNS